MFLFTVCVDSVLAFCLRGIPEFLQEDGQVFADFLGISEAGGINGDKAMAGAALAVDVGVIGGEAHGQDGGEDLADHAVSIALVAAGVFLVSAQGHDPAAFFGGDVFQDPARVVAGLAVFIQGPAVMQGLLRLVVHLQLASGDDGRGGIEEEGVGIRRNCDRDGIGTEHGLSGEGGDHDGLRVGKGHADQALVAGHSGIVAGNAVVVGIAHRDDCHAGFFCFFNGRVHSEDTDELAHPVVSLDDGGHGRLKDDLRLRVHFDDPVLDALVVAHQALHPVGLDAVFVRQEQDVCNDLSLLLRESESLKSLLAEHLQYVEFEIDM